jgi:hypothetical protein
MTRNMAIRIGHQRQRVASLPVALLDRPASAAADSFAAQIGQGAPAGSPAAALRRLLCFAALLLVLAIAMHLVITSGFKRLKTSAFGATNRIMRGAVNADIVVTGSSRALVQYDPRILEQATGRSAFNLGRNGSQTDMQVAFFKAYLHHNRKPALVVHNLDAFAFVTTRAIFDPVQYMPYLSDPALYEASRKIRPETWRSRYLPLYGYVVEDTNLTWLRGVGGFLGWSPKEDYFLGFNPRPAQWTGDFERFRSAHPDGISFPIEDAGVHDLEDLMLTCKQEHIPLILVYAPEYQPMQGMTRNRQEIFARFHQLASQHDVPLWDYSSWSHNGDKALFYNSQHLNAEGAQLFSQDLASRVAVYLQHLPAPKPSAP